VLLLPDGRLGLIDLGQCMVMPEDLKAKFARLVLLLARPRTPEVDRGVAELMDEAGVASQSNDRRFLAFLPRGVFCRIRAEWMVEGGEFHEVWFSDKIVRQPVEFLMCSRAAGLLKGLCFMLQENADIAEAYLPWAQRWLRESGRGGAAAA